MSALTWVGHKALVLALAFACGVVALALGVAIACMAVVSYVCDPIPEE